MPESVKRLVAQGIEVALEAGAGEDAGFPDSGYTAVGASVEEPATLYERADLIAKVRPPSVGTGADEVTLMHPGQMLLTSLMAARHLSVARALAARRVTVFSTDAIPRTTRAQGMDTLSSMASIAGYKGALLAAAELPKYFPMLMTAAGTVLPARVFVIGAGVAGLQAIATARRLGATVFATDVRPEVKEQIESVGGKYVGVELGERGAGGGGYAAELSHEDGARQRDLLARECASADVVISTALVRGVSAPRLISTEMVAGMRPGSVLIDLAADGGGNCELTVPGETVRTRGVSILAPLELAATLPHHASLLWSRNLTNFLLTFWADGALKLDLADEIMRGALIIQNGEVQDARLREVLASTPLEAPRADSHAA